MTEGFLIFLTLWTSMCVNGQIKITYARNTPKRATVWWILNAAISIIADSLCFVNDLIIIFFFTGRFDT